MSVDINVWLECEPAPGAQGTFWRRLAGRVYISRSSLLFKLLGLPIGGWSEVTSLVPLRGLPPGLSPDASEDWEEFGGHDPSYLSYDELVRVQEAYSSSDGTWFEGQLLARTAPVDVGEDWEVFPHLLAAPRYVQQRVYGLPAQPPAGTTLDDYALAVRRHPATMGPQPELAAIIAFLGVYEAHGRATRMVFWFL